MATRSTATKTRSGTTKGGARGAITGVNHLVLICKDMDKTLPFYRDILGLKVRTKLDGARGLATGRAKEEWFTGRFYWMELGNGDVIALREVPGNDPTPDASFAAELWPSERPLPQNLRKMDHLALNVNSLEDLKTLQQRLIDNSVPVSDINYRSDLVHSIYFYDPDNIPLEAATWARPGDGAPDAAPGGSRSIT